MDTYKAEIGEPDFKYLLGENVDWKKGVLIRSTNWLGDACMTLPAVYEISQLLPEDAHLYILAPQNLKSFWEAFPWVKQVMPMSSKRTDAELADKILKLDLGVAVTLPNSFGSAMDIAFKEIPVRVGRKGRFRSFMLTHKLPKWKRVAGKDKHHQLREYLQIAAACGAKTWDDSYEPGKLDISLSHLKDLGFDPNDKWIALAPGAKFGPAKQWPIEHYGEVAKKWLEDGKKVVVIGTPDEKDVAEAVCQHAGGGLNLAGKTNLQELMFILGNVEASVVNDSGGMHLAAAMGGKGVAVFGSTDPRATGPLGGNWRVIWNRIECSPCLKKTCEAPGKDYDCLKGISPQQVLDALESFNHD
ncbi:MAG: lipopolysaccharide heptosyltransferase II [Lentisphaeraceae bacterium]|nr:lipopolysaccharide heptosyltransferase II [Lentisphaeraceae bacterium]